MKAGEDNTLEMLMVYSTERFDKTKFGDKSIVKETIIESIRRNYNIKFSQYFEFHRDQLTDETDFILNTGFNT